MTARNLVLLLLLVLGSCSYATHSALRARAEHLRAAEEYRVSGDYESARDSYQRHIAERLADEKLPKWENPHFYGLIIGDLYLEQGDLKEAQRSYQSALENNVDKNLIADRIRLLAGKYEQVGDYAQAIAVLSHYAHLDPLLTDLLRDRLARDELREEESDSKSTPISK